MVLRERGGDKQSVAGSKGQQGEAQSGALSGEKTRTVPATSLACRVLSIGRFATDNKELENNEVMAMMTRLTLIEGLLCSRRSTKLFMGMISFDPHNNPRSRYYTGST